MDRRYSLLLAEMLVMILVFSLGAAACLGIFAGSRRLCRETARLDEAVILAQNTAELLKAGKTVENLDTGELDLSVTALSPAVPGMKEARIQVSFEGEPVFALTAAWQEVAH